MTVRITDRDRGYDALFKRLNGPPKRLSVGILSESEGASDGSATVGDVATWNEFGTDTIPERSFIRAWADEKESENRELLRKIGQGVIKGTVTADVGLERAGAAMVGSIPGRISAGIAPPNAPSTIAQKRGSTTTLVDEGILRSSISYKVEDA